MATRKKTEEDPSPADATEKAEPATQEKKPQQTRRKSAGDVPPKGEPKLFEKGGPGGPGRPKGGGTRSTARKKKIETQLVTLGQMLAILPPTAADGAIIIERAPRLAAAYDALAEENATFARWIDGAGSGGAMFMALFETGGLLLAIGMNHGLMDQIFATKPKPAPRPEPFEAVVEEVPDPADAAIERIPPTPPAGGDFAGPPIGPAGLSL